MIDDAYDENAADVGLSLELIEEEIEAGLPLHQDSLVRAWVAEEYYAGRNAAFVPMRESEDFLAWVKRPKRTSKMTRKVVRELSKDLYNPGPTRKLGAGSAADGWLQDVYRANHVNSLLQSADRKSLLHGAAAIQAAALGDPDKPIQYYLWGGHEFRAWCKDGDPTRPWACLTINVERQVGRLALEERVRYEAWSRDEHRVYRSRWIAASTAVGPAAMSAGYRRLFGLPMGLVAGLSGFPEGSGKNPYGVLPFVFAHAEPPVSDFHEGALGPMLVECNAEVDRELSDLAEHTREFMNPDRFLRNVAATFRREKVLGRWQPLPPGKNAEGDAGQQPDAFLVQGQLSVDQVWTNIYNYANGTFEELDVPLVAVRDSAATDLSGIAIVSKQLPMLSRTRSRQAPWTETEEQLAAMTLVAAGNYYGEPKLLAAGADPKLACLWPEPRMPLPTPERDEEDTNDRAAGRKSQLQIVAERHGVTIEQAKEILGRVIDEELWYAELLRAKGVAAPEPVAEPPATGSNPDGTPATAPDDGTPPDTESTDES